jgi:hypothetical protein
MPQRPQRREEKGAAIKTLPYEHSFFGAGR